MKLVPFVSLSLLLSTLPTKADEFGLCDLFPTLPSCEPAVPNGPGGGGTGGEDPPPEQVRKVNG